MIAIALDSASDILGVTLRSGDETYHFEMDAGLRHSESLLEIADSLCSRAGILPSSLELVACMKGPGSFTGLRISMAAAKGLATALGIPLLCENTLDCLASPFSFFDGTVIPLIDARKGRFYAALYRGGEPVSGYLDSTPGEIAALVPDGRVLLTGPGAELALEPLSPALGSLKLELDSRFRRSASRELLSRAIDRFTRDGTGDSLDSGILYLRKSEAELELEMRGAVNER